MRVQKYIFLSNLSNIYPIFFQMKTSKIRNIIFDLGGVLIDLSPQKSIDAFQELCGSSFKEAHQTLKNEMVFNKFETGHITSDTFREHIRRFLPQHIEDEGIDKAWNAILLYFPKDRIALLRNLQSRYRLFLLSNTNAIHLQYFSGIYKKEYKQDFNRLFEKAYYSHLMQLRKPDQAIYRQVIDDNRLNPQETLFIDDLEENVKGAEAVGIQGYVLSNGNNVVNAVINELKLLPDKKVG